VSCGVEDGVAAPTSDLSVEAEVTSLADDAATVTLGDLEVAVARDLTRAPTELAAELARRVDAATVQVVAFNRGGLAMGSGVVVGADGHTILTAFHLVGDLRSGDIRGAMNIRVGPWMDYALRGVVVAVDKDNDLAAIRLEPVAGFDGFAALPLADSRAHALGDPVFLFGYPGRREGGLARTRGRVLGIARTAGAPIAMVTDAEAMPGSSGGAVVNARGELLGIVVTGERLPRAVERSGMAALTQVSGFVPISVAAPMLDRAGLR
jgi:S1-C subfamily serine protease